MSTEETEEWLGLPQAKGYEVSSLGRVRSYWKRGCCPVLLPAPRLLKLQKSRDYFVVHLKIDGKVARFRVHQLVLQVFVGPRPEGMICRHLDGDPTNNRPSNLRWGTPKENSEDMMRHGTHVAHKGEACHLSKLTEPEIREIIRLRETGISTSKIGRMFGVHQSLVSRIANRRLWAHVSV